MQHDTHSYTDSRDDLPFMVHSELDDIGLDPFEFRVYAHAVRRAGSRTNNSNSLWESVPNAAKHCRMDHKTYRRAVASLVSMGLLRAVERRGRTTQYFITPKRAWKIPLPETVDPVPEAGPLPETEGVPLPETVDEGNPLKGVPKNLSSSDDDGEWAPPTSSAREVPAEPSSLKRFATAEELNASPKEKEPRARANNKRLKLGDSRFLELVPLIAKAWNEHSGTLRKLRNDSIPQSYLKNTLKFVNELLAEDADPVEATAIVAQVVSKIDWYQERGSFGNAMAAGNWRKHYDSGASDTKPILQLRVGDHVSWERRPGSSAWGRVHGIITHFDERNTPWVKVTKADEPGYGLTEQAVNPNYIRKEAVDE